MINKNTLFILLVVIVISTGCSFAQQGDIQWKSKEHVLYYDEETVHDAAPYLKEKCYLDIEYPSNKPGFATLIFLHGGGLRQGQPWVPENYRRKNFAIVTPGYRLAPEVSCPAYIEDSAAATAWVLKNINKFGGNPNKVFLSGGSAGGYLAAMVGMDARYLAKYGLKPQHLAGVMPISGQMTTHLTVKKEQNIPFTRPIIDEYAPLYYVASNLPPFLVVVGESGLDWPGRIEENAFFAASMKVSGHNKTTFYELKGLNHGNIYQGAVTKVCDFIERICDEIDKTNISTTELVDPKVLPSKGKEIEAKIEKNFKPWSKETGGK